MKYWKDGTFIYPIGGITLKQGDDFLSISCGNNTVYFMGYKDDLGHMEIEKLEKDDAIAALQEAIEWIRRH